MTKVSVILTSFNHAKYIRESIDSVLSQSYSDLELLVLDDASSDNSWQIINSYVDDRIKALRSHANGEIASLINRSIREISAGEYIAIHHSDDVWGPEKLAKQITYLDEHPDIGAVFTWVQVIDETGARIENDWFNRPNQSRWTWLNELFNERNMLNHPSVLIRKACYEEIGDYRHGLWQTVDAEFWSRLLIRHPVHVLEEKLTLHRLFSDHSNMSGDRPEVAVRSSHEWNFVRENLLALRSFDEILQVFPELERWRRPAGFNVKFLLAMACVQSPHRSAWGLGLQWLFELLNDTAQSNQLAELYAFTDISFIELSATLDSYRVEATRQQHRAITEYEAKIQGVLSEYATLQDVLTERDIMLQDAASAYARNVQSIEEEHIDAAKRAQATHLAALSAWEARVEELRRAQAEKDQQAAQLRQLAEAECVRAATEHRRAEAADAQADIERRKAEAADAQADIERRRAEAAGAQADIEHRRAEAAGAQADIEHRRAEAAGAQADIEHRRAEAAGAQADIERRKAEDASAQADIERRKAEAAAEQADIESCRAEAEHGRAETEVARADVERQRADAERGRAAAATHEVLKQREQVRVIEARRQVIAGRLAALESSSSWRVTAPVRRLLANRPRTARTIRRIAKLAWWSATFQFLRRSQKWQTRQQEATAALTPAQPPATEQKIAATFVSQSATPMLDVDKLSIWLAAAKSHLARSGCAMRTRAIEQRYFKSFEFAQATSQAWINLLETLELETQQPEASAEFVLVSASFESHSRVDDFAVYLQASPLFDAHFYLEKIAMEGTPADAVRHYLLIGEPLGICPSPAFDPSYYGRMYPDVTESGLNCLFHYIDAGQREGRRGIMRAIPHKIGDVPVDPRKENVIVVVHETSRTGAPILGWNIATVLARKYNVFSVLLGDGALTPEFEAVSCETIGPLDGVRTSSLDAEFGLAPLFAGRAFKYAIVNSIESRVMIEVCARHLIPTLLLMHEYGSYVWPASALGKALDMATEVVFPAASVARSSLEVHPQLRERGFHIEAQGMSLLPSGRAETKLSQDGLMRTLAQKRADGALIVTGAGSVNLRKGVDSFIAIAADVKRLGAARSIHFLWVGGGYRPIEDMGYSIYLKEQMARAGVEADITFMEEVSDLAPIYAMSDFFMLASRLDPLPNVSIDAVQHGIPIICFKEASGMADLLLTDPETAIGVVPYMDVHAAAEIIVHMASDEPARARLGEATRRFAEATFDMERYVERLDRLAVAHSTSDVQL